MLLSLHRTKLQGIYCKMKKTIAFFLLSLSVFVVYGVADSVKVVLFALNEATFDPALDNNEPSMDDFIDGLTVSAHSGTLDHVTVYGYSSPDGPFSINEKLSVRRCNAIARYISDRTGIPLEDIRTYPGGIAWEGLRDLVTRNPHTPSRDAVIRILDEYIPDACTDLTKSDQCRAAIIALDGGRTYRWMLRNLFPELRYAVAVYSNYPVRLIGTSYVDDDEVFSDSTTDDYTTARQDANTIADESEDLSGDRTADKAGEVSGNERGSVAKVAGDSIPPYSRDNVLNCRPLHRLAIKTNFLYDAALMPNLEVEWRVDDNWSLALEGGVAWWGKYSRNRSYRLAMVSPEVRYWIRPRAPWHGLYVGAFVGGALYDLMKDSPGYRGEGAMGGVSVGYMWPIARNLSLDAEIGAGYLYTRYKEYRPLDGHHVYQNTKVLNYFGPLKVKLSLVWRLWDVNKPRRINAD